MITEDFDGVDLLEEIEVYAQGYTQAIQILLESFQPKDFSFLVVGYYESI
jgi:hypothetical protein